MEDNVAKSGTRNICPMSIEDKHMALAFQLHNIKSEGAQGKLSLDVTFSGTASWLRCFGETNNRFE